MKLFGKELLFNNDRIYHTGDKPTPSEIGAATSNHNHDSVYLRLSGGTMTGAITMANSTAGQLKFKKTDGTAIVGMYVTTGDNLRIGESGILANIYSSDNPKVVTPAGNYTMYHTGYKPTAADVGALPLTGGTITGTMTIPNTLFVKSKAEGDTSSITFRDASNTTVMYIGRSTGTNNIFRIVNSIDGGDISFGTTGAGNMVYTTGNFKLGSSTSKTYRCFEIDRLCGTGGTDKARKVRFGLNDVEGGAAGIEVHEDGKLAASVHFGPTFFRPSPNNTVNLGTSAQKWKDGHFGNVVYANSFRMTNTAYPGIRFSDNVRIEYDAANDNLYAAGTKAQSGGLRPFQATICDSTVHARIAGKKVFVQSGTPSGVATGDVWIQV